MKHTCFILIAVFTGSQLFSQNFYLGGQINNLLLLPALGNETQVTFTGLSGEAGFEAFNTSIYLKSAAYIPKKSEIQVMIEDPITYSFELTDVTERDNIYETGIGGK